MAPKNISFSFLLLILFSLIFLVITASSSPFDHEWLPFSSSSSYSPPLLPSRPLYFPSAGTPGGRWAVLKRSIGISAMHIQLLHDDRLIIFDRTDFGHSNLSLPSGKCRYHDSVVGLDCTAHSILYHVPSNALRPLMVQTDTWCSSGSVGPNGTLFQTGGYRLGERVLRTFTPCPSHQQDHNDDQGSSCDWSEFPSYLAARRWYASNHILPDGRIIVVGGRNSPNYEFFPKGAQNPHAGAVRLRFLAETSDGRHHENNLYPFLHLLPDGHLFVFANNRSILLDYNRNRVVREFPVMPGGDRRSYPLTGSSVLLPINLADARGRTTDAENEMPAIEVLICGGGKKGSFEMARKRIYLEASWTCGRLKLTDPIPQWAMEQMPMPRVMGDMVMLPTGDVLIINGATRGSAGWDNADAPVLNPVLYRTHKPDPKRRFLVMNPTNIPRLYHSAAAMVPDGRVLVGGSNPNKYYNFTGVRYPTELSLEAFSPHYLDPRFAASRPSIVAVDGGAGGRSISHGQVFPVMYDLPAGSGARAVGAVTVTMLLPPFMTHSFGMNQRLLVLGVERLDQVSESSHNVTVRAPRNVYVAPPGFYLLFVVNRRIPSPGVWVHLGPK
ncbi:hypothetical protein Dimus_014959 [Dionaea muscipula]